MPSASVPEPGAFKEWFNAARYRGIADELERLARGFDRARFLALTLERLAERSLMERLRQTATALAAALPGSYPRQLDVVCALAPRIGHNFVGVALCDFVARYGLEDPARSLAALRELTRHGSAEFAVRPFLQRDLAGTLAVMRRWAEDVDEHVRRLASEGSRPRLPWGVRLGELIRDPSPTAPILEALKEDPSLCVRKSVANHLNDIAKDHPKWVLDRVESWGRSPAEMVWIVRHGLRTLVKRGEPRALALLGANAAAVKDIRVARFGVTPQRLRLGEKLTVAAELQVVGHQAETVVIDYVIHYLKATGRTGAKVFKWAVVRLEPGRPLALQKRQTIRDFTTRRHHPGRHRVELQVNGQRLAESAFVIRR